MTEDQVSFTSERDTRAGFFNHPVLNVTWCPTSCKTVLLYASGLEPHLIITTPGPEGVLNYTVTRTNCAEEVSETVNSVSEIIQCISFHFYFTSDDFKCATEIQIPWICKSAL